MLVLEREGTQVSSHCSFLQVSDVDDRKRTAWANMTASCDLHWHESGVRNQNWESNVLTQVGQGCPTARPDVCPDGLCFMNADHRSGAEQQIELLPATLAFHVMCRFKLAAPLPIQLFAGIPGMAGKNAQIPGTLLFMWDTAVEILPPVFSSAEKTCLL